MRLFEKILIVVLGIIYLVNLLPGGLQAGWLSFSLSNLLALVLVIHLGMERSRWQMGPFYFLALLTLVIIFGRQTNPGLWTTPWASAAGLGLLALFSLPPLLLPVPFSPAPKGSYAVGTLTFDWTDPQRAETYSTVSGARRRIMVQAWYPAESHPAGKPSAYIERPEVFGRGLARRLPSFIFRYLSLGRTHAFPNAPMAPAPAAFPVLLFSHGWKGYRSQNNYQVEELASRGYVVLSADHTYGALATIFKDGTVVYYKPEALPDKASEAEYDRAARRLGQAWASDLRFVLDQAGRIQAGEIEAPFSGRLDLEQAGVLGHSTGGGAAVEACWLDPRFKAGLAMDAWMIPYDREIPREGLKQPFLYIQSERWDMPRNAPLAEALYAAMQGWACRLTIAGAHHPDFSELPLLIPVLSLAGFRGRIRPSLQMQIVNEYTLAFFDRFLKGQPSQLLEQSPSPFPQVTIEKRFPS